MNQYDADFWKLYNRYFEKLCQFASNFTPDAESMVQEVFVKIHSKSSEIDITQPRKIAGLLYTMTRQQCIDHLRSDQTRKTTEEGYDELARLDDLSFWELAELDAEFNDKLEAVKLQINRLPKASQRVLKAIFFEGMSMAEYARKHGITEQSGHNLKNKALNTLREKFGHENLHNILLIILLFSGPWKN